MFRIVHDPLSPSERSLRKGTRPNGPHCSYQILETDNIGYRQINPGTGEAWQVLDIGVGPNENAITTIRTQVFLNLLVKTVQLGRVGRPRFEPVPDRLEDCRCFPISFDRILYRLNLIELLCHPIKERRSTRLYFPLQQGMGEQPKRHRDAWRNMPGKVLGQLTNLGCLGPDSHALVLRSQPGCRNKILRIKVKTADIDRDSILNDRSGTSVTIPGLGIQ